MPYWLRINARSLGREGYAHDIQLGMRWKAHAAHCLGDAGTRGVVGARGYRYTHGFTCLHRHADVDGHATRHSAMRKVATRVHDAGVLTATDVCLPPCHLDFLDVGRLGSLTAHAATEQRDAAGAADDPGAFSACRALLVRPQCALGLDVAHRFGLYGNLVAACTDLSDEPTSGSQEEQNDDGQSTHHLAARTLAVLGDS